MHDGVLDHEVLDELRETTGDDFLSELVTTFLDEAPAMIADLKDAANKGDADRFRRAAHSIKSNASSFGATALAELARSMELGDLAEDAAKGGSPLAALAALDAEYARTSAALKGVLNE
ncbi:Hpt domain-containing protein [Marimonas sp. MJW-29]|uniref:Hpt domain-containing protein n=1 Tax=Sulfitobacter sediminis TaxID=3234186 RepID=A0ABV3RMQ8_9RHOB